MNKIEKEILPKIEEQTIKEALPTSEVHKALIYEVLTAEKGDLEINAIQVIDIPSGLGTVVYLTDFNTDVHG